ncbi:MAG: hypothetical protein A2521_14615 [Deltaproteobacteria bacterium RIFOXYD12_FULL_57_12]|nr:MAG: hypothetical protein A2521_14615 [Deltaproteobacteria bacterium RIFOXYD12_FULL_57_12]
MSEQEKQNCETAEEPQVIDQAKADYEQGKVFLDAGDATLAAAAFHNALIGFEQCNDVNGMANAADKLGDICFAREEYPGALRNFQCAYDICVQSQDQFSLLFLKKKIAKAHQRMERFQEAVGIYMDILDIYGGYNNPAGAVKALEELAAIYLEMGDRASAADSYRTAASIHANFGHSRHSDALMTKASAVDAGQK